MLQHFGLRHRNRVDVSESDEVDTAGLAAALAVQETEVSLRRYPTIARSHRSFYGLQLNAARIENRIRRFSPAAIAAGHIHHPAVHELRDLPFSPLGWDMLQEACPCEVGGTRQGWTRVNGTARCDSCGGRLDRVDPILVPDELRSPLSVLAGMVDPDEARREAALALLPTSIRFTNRNLLFDVTVILGECASYDGEGCDQLQQTEGLARACEALLEWPHGLTRFRRGSYAPEWKWERARRNYLVLDSCGDADSSGKAGCGRSGGTRAASSPKVVYQPSGQCGRVEQPFISAMAAARLAGVDEIALKRAWDDGLLPQHSWVQGNLRVRAFDADEVTALAPRLRRAKPRARAALMLGISIFGVEQLAALGLFCPEAPGSDRTQGDVHLAETLRLISQIEERASELIGQAMPLVDAVRHISGRAKPWGVIFQCLMDADVPYTCTSNNEAPLVKRISIPSEKLARITSLEFDRDAYSHGEFERHWNQKDALECLNGDRNAPELLEKLASSGTKPKWYMTSEVEALAAQGVTTSDLARRANLSVTKTYLELDQARVGQIAPGLWHRDAAERVVLS